MVRIKYKVKGLDKLNKKINIITSKLPKVTEKSVDEIIKQIRTFAIKLEKGHHEDGILCELIDISKKSVKGSIYADTKAFPFFLFEHYGTGEFAEMPHIGKTKYFIDSGYTEWLIPVSSVERKLNYPILTIYGMNFYVAHGAKANHFMTDAEFKTRDTNIDIIENKIYELLKEACK